MKKAYYLFNPGRMSRKDQTLCFTPAPGKSSTDELRKRYLPVTGVSALYIFGSVDANSALFNFLGRKQIPVHFFDYYHHYTGSFSPKEYLLSGQLLIAQAKAHSNRKKRMHLATQLVHAATFNMVKNLKYYINRGRGLGDHVGKLESYRQDIPTARDIQALMGYEGNCRQIYYDAFEEIMPDYKWEGRSRQPPTNELNALVSFGNSLCYTVCLDAIYNSQLNPTISFLHEPGVRRYSLALDIAEIFKPILVDRLIFRLCNRKELRTVHFDLVDQACFLSEKGRKLTVTRWEERLQQTIKHRSLNHNVSYRHLIRLECYKLAKHLLGMESDYSPFKSWW